MSNEFVNSLDRVIKSQEDMVNKLQQFITSNQFLLSKAARESLNLSLVEQQRTLWMLKAMSVDLESVYGGFANSIPGARGSTGMQTTEQPSVSLQLTLPGFDSLQNLARGSRGE